MKTGRKERRKKEKLSIDLYLSLTTAPSFPFQPKRLKLSLTDNTSGSYYVSGSLLCALHILILALATTL